MLFCYFVLCGFFIGCGDQQPIPVIVEDISKIKKEVDAYLDKVVNSDILFNGNIAISKDGKIIYSRSIGYENVPNKIPLNENSIFRLCSTSKSFTATVILKLHELKIIDIENNVVDYLPDFPFRDIKIIQLLNHTSGIKDYMNILLDNWNDYNVPATNIDIYRLLKEKKHLFFNKRFEGEKYSNTNYALLPILVEKVTGEKYADVLTKYVFEPGDLKKTKIFTSFEKKYPKNFAYRHKINISSGVIETVPYAHSKYGAVIGSVLGDGSIYSTAEDLVKFDKALREGKILNKSSIELSLQTKDKSKKGLGWEVQNKKPLGKIVHHHGKFDGSRVRYHRILDKKITIITMTNAEGFYTGRIHNNITKIIAGVEVKNLPKLYVSEQLKKEVYKISAKSLATKIETLISNDEKYKMQDRLMVKLAGNLWDINQPNKGLVVLEQAHANFPNSVVVLGHLSDGYLETGNFSKSRIHYQKLIKLLKSKDIYDKSWQDHIKTQLKIIKEKS